MIFEFLGTFLTRSMGYLSKVALFLEKMYKVFKNRVKGCSTPEVVALLFSQPAVPYLKHWRILLNALRNILLHITQQRQTNLSRNINYYIAKYFMVVLLYQFVCYFKCEIMKIRSIDDVDGLQFVKRVF